MRHTLCVAETKATQLDHLRIAPTENMRRFDDIALQPTLCGQVAVVRCWGRIGTRGRSMTITYPDVELAASTFTDLKGQKRRRGYVPTAD